MGFNVKKALKTTFDVVTLGQADNFKDLWNDFTGKSGVDKQNQYNLQMWEMQNAYNTPANQVARLREAGLNPNLFYSQGNLGNANSAPDMVAHQGGVAKAFDLAKIALSLKNMGITNRNLQAQTNNIDAQTAQHWADVDYKTAILDFYAKHGYFPGQTNAVPNVVTEVVNRAKDIAPVVSHQASVAKEVLSNFLRYSLPGREWTMAEEAANRKGLEGRDKRRYMDKFIEIYKQTH